MTQLIPCNQNQSDLMLRKPHDSITYNDHESIRRACDIIYDKSKHSENDMWLRDRNKLLLSMMWVTGARVSDVLAMKEENIKFGEKASHSL